MFIGMYRPPRTHERHIPWDFLTSTNDLTFPIVILGDLKQVRNPNEKLSAFDSLRGAKAFNELINNLYLIDLQPHNNRYTWTNRKSLGREVWERLDRFYCNISWLDLCGNSWTQALPIASFDYSPISLNATPLRYNHKKTFKFEEMWLKDPSCTKVVEDAWRKKYSSPLAFQFQAKVKEAASSLRNWNVNYFGNVNQQILDIEK